MRGAILFTVITTTARHLNASARSKIKFSDVRKRETVSGDTFGGVRGAAGGRYTVYSFHFAVPGGAVSFPV